MQQRKSCDDSLDLSVIVPLYNEEESIEALYESIVKSVDDGMRNFNICLLHYFQGQWVEFLTGISGANNFHFGRSQFLCESLGHLASPAVSGTEEKNTNHILNRRKLPDLCT